MIFYYTYNKFTDYDFPTVGGDFLSGGGPFLNEGGDFCDWGFDIFFLFISSICSCVAMSLATFAQYWRSKVLTSKCLSSNPE